MKPILSDIVKFQTFPNPSDIPFILFFLELFPPTQDKYILNNQFHLHFIIYLKVCYPALSSIETIKFDEYLVSQKRLKKIKDLFLKHRTFIRIFFPFHAF